MNKTDKKNIDGMSYEFMLDLWRNAQVGHRMFQGELGAYFSKVMAKKKAALSTTAQVSASKRIGWGGHLLLILLLTTSCIIPPVLVREDRRCEEACAPHPHTLKCNRETERRYKCRCECMRVESRRLAEGGRHGQP